MQTRSRKKKSTRHSDLNSRYRWGTNFTQKFSAASIERVHVSMFSTTMHRVNRTNTELFIKRQLLESRVLQYNQFMWVLIQHCPLNSLLSGLIQGQTLTHQPSSLILSLTPISPCTATHDCFFFTRAYSTSGRFLNLNIEAYSYAVTWDGVSLLLLTLENIINSVLCMF